MLNLPGNFKVLALAKHGATGLLLLGYCFLSLAAMAQSSYKEYQVKSVFLLNFTRFVTWPENAFADPADPIRLCVFGEDPFDNLLEKVVEGERVNQREVVIKRFKDMEGLTSCHLLFFSAAEKNNLPKLLEILNHSPVLTVSEYEGFAHQGGIINFIWKEGAVHFEINLEVAKQAELEISFKLLKLATVIEK